MNLTFESREFYRKNDQICVTVPDLRLASKHSAEELSFQTREVLVRASSAKPAWVLVSEVTSSTQASDGAWGLRKRRAPCEVLSGCAQPRVSGDVGIGPFHAHRSLSVALDPPALSGGREGGAGRGSSLCPLAHAAASRGQQCPPACLPSESRQHGFAQAVNLVRIKPVRGKRCCGV